MELWNTDTLEEAREKLWKETADMEPGVCMAGLDEAYGKISAEELFSGEDLPPFARSTVDGYALAAQESYGAGESSPVFLHICGEVRIEEEAVLRPGPGEAVRVQTGSMMPPGTDAVVMLEYTEEYIPGEILCFRPVSPGENVIRAGEDIPAGARILARGQRIGVGEIGMLAGLGFAGVRVRDSLDVTILSTGDELAGPGEPLEAGRIRDVNTDALAAAVQAAGMKVRKKLRLRDQKEELRQAVWQESAESHVVLISGGSSRGSRDFTKQVLEEVTGNVFTHGLALKPGKPGILAYDREKRTVLAGLPGHPMAAVLVFRLLIAHWYQRKTGAEKALPVPAVMGGNVSSNQGRETCLLVQLYPEIREEVQGGVGYTAMPVYAKSGSISALAQADAFVLIPRDREGLKKGERIWAELL